MTSALLLASTPAAARSLQAELAAAGIHVLGACERGNLVQDTIRLAPDVLVCQDPRPDDALLDAFETLHKHAPLPVLLLSSDTDAGRVERALEVGVQEYVFGGHDAARLRPLVQLALVRFRRQRQLLERLGDVTQRFEERKLVDRAKGLLMSLRGVSEDEAYKLLRAGAMQAGQRLGDVARQVIDGARQAADVNRSGQLRMLSQRIVKLQALAAAGTRPAEARALLALSTARVREILDGLRGELSVASFGDLLDTLLGAWQTVEAALAAGTGKATLAALDDAAEGLLRQSETLTAALQHAGGDATLAIVNLAGRQRMLSQRVAKLALLGGPAEPLARACAEFDLGLAGLRAAPLSSDEIRATLEEAETLWQQMQAGIADVGRAAGREALAAASEGLLEPLERLTGQVERSLQVLMG